MRQHRNDPTCIKAKLIRVTVERGELFPFKIIGEKQHLFRESCLINLFHCSVFDLAETKHYNKNKPTNKTRIIKKTEKINKANISTSFVFLITHLRRILVSMHSLRR